MSDVYTWVPDPDTEGEHKLVPLSLTTILDGTMDELDKALRRCKVLLIERSSMINTNEGLLQAILGDKQAMERCGGDVTALRLMSNNRAKRIEELRERIRTLESEVLLRNGRIGALEVERDRLIDANDQLSREVGSKLGLLTKVNADLLALQGANEELESALGKYKTEVESQREVIESMDAHNERLRKENAALARELAEAREAADHEPEAERPSSLMNDYKAAKRSLEMLEARNAELVSESRYYKGLFDQADASVGELQQFILGIKNSIDEAVRPPRLRVADNSADNPGATRTKKLAAGHVFEFTGPVFAPGTSVYASVSVLTETNKYPLPPYFEGTTTTATWTGEPQN